MSDETSKIVLRKNEDGTTTKVVVKKVTRKVKIKAAGAKPESSTEKPAEATPKSADPTTRAPGRDNRPAGSPPRGRTPTDRNQARGGDKKKKIFVARNKSGGPPPMGVPPVLPPGEKSSIEKKLQDKKKHDQGRVNTDKLTKHEDDKYQKLSNQFRQRENKKQDEFANVPESIEIPEVISIKNLAMKLNLKAVQVIKKFLTLGVMDLTVNDSIDAESAEILCSELNCTVKVVSLLDQTRIEEEKGNPDDYITRAPIVTVMGHVDHGKTTLLDAIRSSNVVGGESGGITQHIGAYKVTIDKGSALFIDTPGHAAFTNMRQRGTQITDVVILVVAATDGIMPQTIESIKLARDAKVPIVVAVNKCDAEGANPEQVKTQLAEHNLVPENWGGDTQFINVSALKKEGIKELLEAVILQSDFLELKANPKVRASGYVIESKVEKGKGNVATVIIKNGTLKVSDSYLCGLHPGRVRAMFDDAGKQLKVAPPSTPVEIMGLSGLPNAGDRFEQVANEKEAKKVAERRLRLKRENVAQNFKKVTMGNLFETMKEQQMKELKVLIKGDVYGTVEAIKDAMEKLRNDEVKVNVIHFGAGEISENDVELAATSEAIIIAFKVKPNAQAKRLVSQKKVEIIHHSIIYDIIENITARLEEMLEAEIREIPQGNAEVKEVFRISGVGKIAGCIVVQGKVYRDSKVRVHRNGEQIFEGEIAVLKHYKDEVKEIPMGTECGIQIRDFQDLKVEDKLELFRTEKVERKLEIKESD